MNQRQAPATNHDVAEERAVRRFLERAAPIILEARTLDGARFDQVVALADALGLSRQQLSCELRFLQLRGVIDHFPSDRLDAADAATPDTADAPPLLPDVLPDATPDATPEASSESDAAATATSDSSILPTAVEARPAGQASDAEGPTARPDATPVPQPVDRPPPVPEAPAEAFRRWVQQKLAGYPSVVLAEEDEVGLIGVGTFRFHLADVLAGHIVRDEATARDMRLARDLDGASCHSTVAESGADDVRLQAFFEQVAPILAQHRGVNVQSRILIDALAQQFHLTAAELDRALTLLQRSAGGVEAADPRQQERRESYRSYLRRAMAQLPDGIVTFQAQRRLMEAGEHFHGVAPQWIRPTINEVASEMGVRFVSQDQAVQHVASLVQDIAADGRLTDAAARARVYAAGTRWGLDPIEVDLILRRQAERARRQAAAERRRTRWILGTAAAVFAGGVALLVWLIVPRPPRPALASPATHPHTTAVSETVPAKPEAVAWWDDDTRIGVARARRAHPNLQELLEQARSADPAARGEAYAQLAAWYVQEGRAASAPRIEALFTGWFAGEPDGAAAERIPAALLAPSLALDGTAAPAARGLAAAFRGARAAARLATVPTLTAARRAQLDPLFQAALQVSPEQVLGAPDAARAAAAGLARRCYAALVPLAADQPARVHALYRVLASETAASLDDASRHRLDAELLAALLPELDRQWVDYQDVLRSTARSPDPAVLRTLLDLFARAADPQLRHLLADCFAEHAGVAPGTRTDLEVVDALRQSLGITAREQLRARWDAVTELAARALGDEAAAAGDTATLLQQAVDLARCSALACALAAGDAGAAVFEELESAGARRLDAPEAGEAERVDEPFVTPYPLPPATVLRHYIDKLASSRAAHDRMALLRLMATAAESVPDVDPVAGQTLAEYLWRAKPLEEHQELLTHLPKFADWNALRLGVADRLADAASSEPRRQALARIVCGREVNLADDAGRLAARQQLLAKVLRSLPETARDPSAAEQRLDAANRALAHFYLVQARLLQVPLSSDTVNDEMTAVLSAVLTHVAGTLDRAALTPREQQLVDTLPERLTAAAFVAESDLHYAVLLQQMWLQVLAAHLARPLSAQALSIRAIADETQAAAAACSRVDQQLRALEVGLLRLWLLYRPDPAAPAAIAHRR